jgi:hypothetical protein
MKQNPFADVDMAKLHALKENLQLLARFRFGRE